MATSKDPLLPTHQRVRPSSRPAYLLFVLLIIAGLGLLVKSQSTMKDTLTTLGNEWNTLRSQQGHFSGGEYNPELDGFNGRKFQVMKELGVLLEQDHVPASTVLQVLGKPDELANSVPSGIAVDQETDDSVPVVTGMPGPIVGQGLDPDAGKPYYLVYHWRGKHDFLWFKIQGLEEKVASSGWYHAGE